MKTTKGNKLIAEFMGCVIIGDVAKRTSKEWDWPMSSGLTKLVDHLKYHSSWDWLMPVVEKIVNEESSCCHFSGLGYIYDDKISFSMLDDCKHVIQVNTKGLWINAVWNGVVEYVQWYNENKLSDEELEIGLNFLI